MDQEGYDDDDLYNIYGKEIADLTKEEASGMIGWLKGPLPRTPRHRKGSIFWTETRPSKKKTT